MTPAARLSPLSVGVLVALETFENVVTGAETGVAGQRSGVVRTYTAAADEHEQRFMIDLLFELRKKIFVLLVPRIAHPLDFDRAWNSADPLPFGTRAHVDKSGARCQAQELARLPWRQGARVRQFELLGARLRKTKDVGQFAHGDENGDAGLKV